MFIPVHIFSTAGTKYLSQTTASAKNKYKLQTAWSTTAPACRCSSVKKSFGKSSMAGCVQFRPKDEWKQKQNVNKTKKKKNYKQTIIFYVS